MLPCKRKISVTGLGYVGLTIATAFGQNQKVIGYDKSLKRIEELRQHHDVNGEISDELLKTAHISYTTNPADLQQADFHIVAVLTPVTSDHQPDFSILLNVTETIGKQLKKRDIVVYESTVYPGATEEKCIPILEKTSGLICGKDFSVGYSPERINPSDKDHTFANIIKIISAVDEQTLQIMAEVYGSVVKAGVYPVSSIRVAEATKIIENTQRDMNISFINEIALMLHSFNMDSYEVIKAARTKWNFLPFQPGLVGGHCIGVNSYYLAHKAEEVGYHPEIIEAGRRINEYMPKFLAEKTLQKLATEGIATKKARIAILGLTYKENCPDLHDTKVIDMIQEIKSSGAEILVHDPLADPVYAKKAYGLELKNLDDLNDCDAMIIAVAHKSFTKLTKAKIQKILKPRGLIMDVKGILNPKDFLNTEISVWRL